MSKPPDGGPAFPYGVVAGMSLRDWLAGTIDAGDLGSVLNAAFAKVLMGEAPDYEDEPEAYLAWFVRFEAKIRWAKADAMLAEKGRT